EERHSEYQKIERVRSEPEAHNNQKVPDIKWIAAMCENSFLNEVFCIDLPPLAAADDVGQTNRRSANNLAGKCQRQTDGECQCTVPENDRTIPEQQQVRDRKNRVAVPEKEITEPNHHFISRQ